MFGPSSCRTIQEGEHVLEIQAINWPLARIEEAISAIDEDEQRERLLGRCKATENSVRRLSNR